MKPASLLFALLCILCDQSSFAATQPDNAKELAAKWEARVERAHVKPYPGEGEAKKKGKGRMKTAKQ